MQEICNLKEKCAIKITLEPNDKDDTRVESIAEEIYLYARHKAIKGRLGMGIFLIAKELG